MLKSYLSILSFSILIFLTEPALFATDTFIDSQFSNELEFKEGVTPTANLSPSLDNLPLELLCKIFSFAPIEALGGLPQVSRYFREVSNEPALWREVHQKQMNGDYPPEQATKQTAVRHQLRVRVNLEKNFKSADDLIKKYAHYALDQDLPYQKWRKLVFKKERNYLTEAIRLLLRVLSSVYLMMAQCSYLGSWSFSVNWQKLIIIKQQFSLWQSYIR